MPAIVSNLLIFIAGAGGVLCFLPLFLQTKSHLESGLLRDAVTGMLCKGSSLVSITLSIVIALDLSLEVVPRLWRKLFNSGEDTQKSKKAAQSLENDRENDFLDDSERLLFISGMIVAPISIFVTSVARENVALVYLCGRMSQICMVASAIVISLYRCDHTLFPTWAAVAIVTCCVIGTIGGAFLSNTSPSSNDAVISAPAVLQTVTLIIVAVGTISFCVVWLYKAMKGHIIEKILKYSEFKSTKRVAPQVTAIL
jgi:hypothetical protein